MSKNPYVDQVKEWAAAHSPENAASIKALPEELFCDLYKEYYDLGPEPENTKGVESTFQAASVLFKELDTLSYEAHQMSMAMQALVRACRPVQPRNLAKTVTSIYGCVETFRGVYAINAFRVETQMPLSRAFKQLLDDAFGRTANIDEMMLGYIYLSVVDEESGTEVTCPESMRVEIRDAYGNLQNLIYQINLQRA